MERSTPINHLQRGGQAGQAEEMVDDIVDDLEEEQRYMQQQQQHSEQQFHQPPPPQQHPQQHPQQYQRAPPGHQPMLMRPPVPPSSMQGLENSSLPQRVLSEAKEPLLVSVLVIIMSSPQLQSLIARFLPIAASNPLIGLAVRAMFAGILFWLLRRFIPNA